MIVSHAHKLIFTHIPKNAGTSIGQWFLEHVPDAEAMPSTLKHHTPHPPNIFQIWIITMTLSVGCLY